MTRITISILLTSIFLSCGINESTEHPNSKNTSLKINQDSLDSINQVDSLHKWDSIQTAINNDFSTCDKLYSNRLIDSTFKRVLHVDSVTNRGASIEFHESYIMFSSSTLTYDDHGGFSVNYANYLTDYLHVYCSNDTVEVIQTPMSYNFDCANQNSIDSCTWESKDTLDFKFYLEGDTAIKILSINYSDSYLTDVFTDTTQLLTPFNSFHRK